MDLIGENVGVSGPAIYGHFASKEQLLVTLIDQALAEINSAAHLVLSNPSEIDALRLLIEFHVEFVLRDYRLSKIYVTEHRHLPAGDRERLEDLQRSYIALWSRLISSVRTDLSEGEVDAIAKLCIGFVNSVVFYKFKLNKLEIARLVEEGVKLLVNHVAAPRI